MIIKFTLDSLELPIDVDKDEVDVVVVLTLDWFCNQDTTLFAIVSDKVSSSIPYCRKITKKGCQKSNKYIIKNSLPLPHFFSNRTTFLENKHEGQ